MKILLLFYIGVFFSLEVFSQINFSCTSFTYEGKRWEDGSNLKRIFEVSLSNKKLPFRVVEREEINIVFEKLQEEKNLYKDLLMEFAKKPELAGADYVVVGNVVHNIGTQKYSLNINFFKYTGKETSIKLPIFLSLSKDQLADDDQMKKIFDGELQNFYENFFVTKDGGLDLSKKPDFYSKIEQQDSIIKRLEKDVNNIKDYSNLSRIGVNGTEFGPGGDIEVSTPLSILMKNIFETKGAVTRLIQTDSALIYADKVIAHYPKFPFGYYAKAFILLTRDKKNSEGLKCAKKALEILEITTTIDGHNANHDEGLQNIKVLISRADS